VHHNRFAAVSQGFERVNQNRRTRAAVLAAAVALAGRGIVPTIASAAAEADVSRATAYRYWANHDQLLAEVAAEPWAPQVARALSAQASADPVERVDALARSLHAVVTTHEAMFRAILRLSLTDSGAEGSSAATPRLRGGRRLRWIEEALAPVHEEVGPARFKQLVAALTVATGIEAVVVLRDICGLTSLEAEQVISWAVRTLVRAELGERRPQTDP
jgi:AcrR family transcriptional regulator